MTLNDIGFNSTLENYILENKFSEFVPGRVTQEHRERYVVSTGDYEYDAEITGNLRFTSNSRTDFPAVGDWVLMTIYEPDMAIIHKVLPRKSVLERQSVSKFGEKQIISANIDYALIMQSIDINFNINRFERYLTVCYSSDIEPLLIISKTDLATPERIRDVTDQLESRIRKVRTVMINNLTQEGFESITGLLQKGKTYCVVGSSGVGKSTLINNLLRQNILKTDSISNSTNKGKHVTSHRELFVLENGAIIIDTPGMRELGITEDSSGIKSTFDDIVSLSSKCRFSNCTHINEAGCAVLEAVAKGTINSDTLENYFRIQRDQQRFQISVAEKHKKDQKLGRLYKYILKEKKKNK
jgi:ribosome biogenesis GTPase / thiamine phosphate phosphatase